MMEQRLWRCRRETILLRAARYGSTIEAIKRLDACGRLRALRVRRWRIAPPKRSFCGTSLEYAVMLGDEEEAERIREELRRVTG